MSDVFNIPTQLSNEDRLTALEQGSVTGGSGAIYRYTYAFNIGPFSNNKFGYVLTTVYAGTNTLSILNINDFKTKVIRSASNQLIASGNIYAVLSGSTYTLVPVMAVNYYGFLYYNYVTDSSITLVYDALTSSVNSIGSPLLIN